PDFVKSMDSQNSRVVTTQDLRSGWKIEDFRDNVHPSTLGQKKMAEAYFDALMGNQLILKRK
ncbi:MAG: hypothetical protein NTY06_03500, partial [Candidatus Gottesmanbacteria bacterium]|nr:hypothetical protein [Candidatus Gottesmanbacteria bacterium]